jgi:hypothetical protein
MPQISKMQVMHRKSAVSPKPGGMGFAADAAGGLGRNIFFWRLFWYKVDK